MYLNDNKNSSLISALCGGRGSAQKISKDQVSQKIHSNAGALKKL